MQYRLYAPVTLAASIVDARSTQQRTAAKKGEHARRLAVSAKKCRCNLVQYPLEHQDDFIIERRRNGEDRAELRRRGGEERFRSDRERTGRVCGEPGRNQRGSRDDQAASRRFGCGSDQRVEHAYRP